MRETYSIQYDRPCVYLDPTDGDPAEIIEYAEEIGAVYSEDDDDDCLVLDWPIRGQREVGPELYTREAVRRTIRTRTKLSNDPATRPGAGGQAT